MNALNPTSGALDYAACCYGTSHLLFRGPKRELEGEYTVCIGSSETFGRFIRNPYPALLEEAIGQPCVNLGLRDAGIDAFLASPGLIDIAAKSTRTVIQVMGAANMSNRLYTVDPRRNHRFIRASKNLKKLYPEVDFREFEQTSHMLTELARVCLDRLQQVRRELQSAWVARMRTLTTQIGGDVTFLWLSDHTPYTKAEGGTICRDPLFVDRAMLNAVCCVGAGLVEVIVTAEEVEAGLPEMVFSPMEISTAKEMLGPIAHRRAAVALEQAISGMQ